MALATDRVRWTFFCGRAAVGIGLGIGGSAASAYLAEIAPPAWRGRFLEFNELCVCFGCLGAYAVAYGLGDEHWRTSIGLTSLVAVLQLLLILLVLHESPHMPIVYAPMPRALSPRPGWRRGDGALDW